MELKWKVLHKYTFFLNGAFKKIELTWNFVKLFLAVRVSIKNKECGCRISCNAALRALSVDLINTANCGAAMSTHTNIFGIISRIFHFLASKNISLKYHFKIHWRQSLWRKEKKTNFYQCNTLLLSTLVYFFHHFPPSKLGCTQFQRPISHISNERKRVHRCSSSMKLSKKDAVLYSTWNNIKH